MTNSTETIAERRARREIAARLVATLTLVEAGERPLTIPCSGTWTALVHRSTATAGAWQGTILDGESPVTHVEGAYALVLSTLARDYGADLGKAVAA